VYAQATPTSLPSLPRLFVHFFFFFFFFFLLVRLHARAVPE
jgi:hypothetical protein